jgi:hypothetical protein
MKKAILFLTAIAGLLTAVHAQIGYTLADCQAHWGKSVYREGKNYFDHVKVHNSWTEIRATTQDGGQEISGKIVSIVYTKNVPIPVSVAEKLLLENCPDVQWVKSNIIKNEWIAYTPERWATIVNLKHDPDSVADFTPSADGKLSPNGCSFHIEADCQSVPRSRSALFKLSWFMPKIEVVFHVDWRQASR